MKKYNVIIQHVILFSSLLFSSYLFAQEKKERVDPTIKGETQKKPIIDSIEVSLKLLRKIKKGKVILIDVRTPEEYQAGHLKYSQNIDYKKEDFKTQIDKLNKKTPVYLYCRTGNRSSKSADILKDLGFTTVYNIGGFEYLKNAGLPIE
jgi:phage shock protein E